MIITHHSNIQVVCPHMIPFAQTETTAKLELQVKYRDRPYRDRPYIIMGFFHGPFRLKPRQWPATLMGIQAQHH